MTGRQTRSVGKDGIERWDDGTPVSPGNAFTQAFGGQGLDVKAMAQAARNAAAISAHVSSEVAKGNNLGKIYGLSRKSDEHTRRTKPPGKAVAIAKQMPEQKPSKRVAIASGKECS